MNTIMNIICIVRSNSLVTFILRHVWFSYVAVALTIQYRFKLLEATSPVSLERILKHLPKRLVQEANAMEVLEDVIATSIEYMYAKKTDGCLLVVSNKRNCRRLTLSCFFIHVQPLVSTSVSG